MVRHAFTKTIEGILGDEFGEDAALVIAKQSKLVEYLNLKTRSASRGSKSRASFGNLYAIYVLVEDYVSHGYDARKDYASYEGAKFSDLFRRQRELPFGSKLQNHALNHRLNQEFRKFFPTEETVPIVRNPDTRRYWFNENLLVVECGGKRYNLAAAVIRIIDAYVEARKDSFQRFIESCDTILRLNAEDSGKAREFVVGLLQPSVDARIFEIVSFAIMKAHYAQQSVFWGWSEDDLSEEALVLYKTGRTNANDGGIDFVMRPLGRFFQVTETVDVRKYFLDIEKIQRYPLTFVVKSTDEGEVLSARIRTQAKAVYGVDSVVDRLMGCIEEIINVPSLLDRFDQVVAGGGLSNVIDEVIRQSEVEFNAVAAESENASLATG